jgi:hypothetical protein
MQPLLDSSDELPKTARQLTALRASGGNAMDCSAANHFGWLVGIASGTCAMTIIIILIASAPAYRADVPMVISEKARSRTQWVLLGVQFLLFCAWAACGYLVGMANLGCYASTLSLGAVAVIAPVMLLLIFTAANWIGRAGAR